MNATDDDENGDSTLAFGAGRNESAVASGRNDTSSQDSGELIDNLERGSSEFDPDEINAISSDIIPVFQGK